MHYLPLTPGLFSLLALLFLGLIILIQLRILRYAYMRLGLGPGMNPVPGEKAAGSVESTGCKIQWPA